MLQLINIMTRGLFNKMLWFKIPIAKIAGLKLHHFDHQKSQILVKHSWINQNPFKSMFWAVQGMAAEFSTGILCIDKIQKSGQKISMLVVGLEANFTKKATGKIIFTCDQGAELDAVLGKAIVSKEGQILKMRSIGIDEKGDQVSEFFFTWSFKVKN
jgi:hypothetical protein